MWVFWFLFSSFKQVVDKFDELIQLTNEIHEAFVSTDGNKKVVLRQNKEEQVLLDQKKQHQESQRAELERDLRKLIEETAEGKREFINKREQELTYSFWAGILGIFSGSSYGDITSCTVTGFW